MPEKPLTSLLSPNSNLRSKVASLDSAIDTLRANGMESQANMLYSNLQQAIANKDIDNLKAYSGQLMALNTKNLTVPAEARTPKDEVAKSIEQLVSVADSRNIAIPPAILNDAANAFISKDQGAVAALANNINSLLEKNIEAQITENKVPTRLEDGSVVLIGQTTRTRYDQTNTPIPSSNKNAQLFSLLASDAYSPQSKEIMAAMGGESDLVGASAIGASMQKQPDIGAKPEAYASIELPALSTIELKEKARGEVRELYLSGDKESALDKINSAGGKGLFGGDYTMADLDEMYKKEGDALPTTSSTSDVNFDSLSPEKKRAYLDSLTPEEKQDFLNKRLNKK